jgi:hypothetical protein
LLIAFGRDEGRVVPAVRHSPFEVKRKRAAQRKAAAELRLAEAWIAGGAAVDGKRTRRDIRHRGVRHDREHGVRVALDVRPDDGAVRRGLRVREDGCEGDRDEHRKDAQPDRRKDRLSHVRSARTLNG